MLCKIFPYLVRFYQDNIRAMFPVSCRFMPNCSEYARQAVLKYGITRGVLKAAKRLMLCHPFSGKSGYYPLT